MFKRLYFLWDTWYAVNFFADYFFKKTLLANQYAKIQKLPNNEISFAQGVIHSCWNFLLTNTRLHCSDSSNWETFFWDILYIYVILSMGAQIFQIFKKVSVKLYKISYELNDFKGSFLGKLQ